MNISVHMLNSFFFFFQAEDGIRDLVRSRGLGDVYKRQIPDAGRYHYEKSWTLPEPGDVAVAGSYLYVIVANLSLIHI